MITLRTAKKSYTCCVCGLAILPGQEYVTHSSYGFAPVERQHYPPCNPPNQPVEPTGQPSKTNEAQ